MGNRPLRILEIGIGKDCRVIRRGLYDDAFASISNTNNIELIGVDIVPLQPGVLEKAKDVLSKENNNVLFKFVRGTPSELLKDFDDDYFDCIICTLTLCSVDDPTFALNEIKRVLRKDGGTFGYVKHVAVNPDESQYRILEFQQLALDGVQQLLADNCHLHRYTDNYISNVFGASSTILTKERFIVDDMWPVSCQTTTNNDKNTDDNEKEVKKKKKSRWEKIKEAWVEYRYVFVAYYVVAWATPVLPIWMGLECFGLDGVALLEYIGVDNVIPSISNWNPSLINGLIAIEINELGEIVRLPLVISTTPTVAKMWRNRGKK
mmetsp:Transcript_14284/g.15900  ORF Transcript_14284/g.15900 Transcript_14284/m.15900 type:complete len:320 (+) Transcript_14284:1500-2459(+)